ncbi:MAG TPA: hypothetical protein VHH35_15740 [Pyrinomonadaceae bacterium]|nr:hypothetical protein [Pyrinomonadaceae bacterium]
MGANCSAINFVTCRLTSETLCGDSARSSTTSAIVRRLTLGVAVVVPGVDGSGAFESLFVLSAAVVSGEEPPVLDT